MSSTTETEVPDNGNKAVPANDVTHDVDSLEEVTKELSGGTHAPTISDDKTLESQYQKVNISTLTSLPNLDSAVAELNDKVRNYRPPNNSSKEVISLWHEINTLNPDTITAMMNQINGMSDNDVIELSSRLEELYTRLEMNQHVEVQKAKTLGIIKQCATKVVPHFLSGIAYSAPQSVSSSVSYIRKKVIKLMLTTKRMTFGTSYPNPYFLCICELDLYQRQPLD